MILGRTAENKIKIKTDEAGGGLRAVECGCCGPTDFQPCRDCPPVLGNWNFSLSGDQVNGYTSFEYPPDNQYDPLRTCFDNWDAYGPGAAGTNLYTINLARAYGGWYGAPLGTPCCWVLGLSIQGYFEYCCFMGYPDICSAGFIPPIIITSLDPRGSYNFTMYSQCKPPCFTGAPDCQDEPFEFYFTVTIS